MISITGARRFGLAGFLAALGACSGGSDVATPAPVVIPPVAQVVPGTWVVMGSSTAAGAGAPPGKGWVALIAEAYSSHGAQIVNIAKGASATYEGLSIAASPVSGRPAPDPNVNIDQALSRKPVLLILSYPSNDTSRGYTSDETVNNLLAMRAQALAAGVPVIVTSSQPRNLSDVQLARLQEIDERLAAGVGGCFVDVRAGLAGPDRRLASGFDSGDGVHPNTDGHQKIFTTIRQLVDGGYCIKL